MRFIDETYYANYSKKSPFGVEKCFNDYDFSEESGSFDYLTKASAVYSSNIEGNSIDLNSYMNYELNKTRFKKGKEIEEIEDLINAYAFAQNNRLNEINLLKAHELSSKTILIKSNRGRYRNEMVGVYGTSGLIYLAIEPDLVGNEMNAFFEEISSVLNENLTVAQCFFYASIIHLRFAHIHPFRDGNGRMARLLEKWFLAEKLGEQCWKIPSEEFYKENQKRYYKNINLGVNFYALEYSNCFDFLYLLPESLIFKN